jgi:ABC-type lipoprotein release transport system permease subunit
MGSRPRLSKPSLGTQPLRAGSTPIVLATGLATGAVVGLALALTATVKRRRRGLALLKTFGFTNRQLAVTLAWQATFTALTGIAIGLPLGIAAGRQLWRLFAQSIDAVPQPTVPLSVFVVAVGALLLANIVAAIPGPAASGTPAATVLRGG